MHKVKRAASGAHAAEDERSEKVGVWAESNGVFYIFFKKGDFKAENLGWNI